MATFIDPQDEELQEEEQLSSTPEPSEQPEDNTEEVASPPPVEAFPDKYQGKTLDEIIKMHQEAEKLIGRQAQEVGEVRKLADELIKRQLESKQTPDANVTEQEEEVDWFENPEKAVQKAVDKHPTVRKAEATLAEIQKQQFFSKLDAQFPEYQQTIADPDFAQWIQASPVRLRLYAAADTNLDFDSAAELLNTWKYVKPAPAKVEPQAVKAVPPQVKADREAAMKAVAVDTGSSGNVSTKVYRRSDLIRLQLEDPNRYMELQDDIMAAYKEGRVR